MLLSRTRSWPILFEGRERANGIENVQLLSAAVSEHPKLAELLIAGHGRASNRLKELGRLPHGGVRDSVVVHTVTLDQMLAHFGAPELVKIDAEGAEVGILSGGATLLREARPVLLIEVIHTNVAPMTALLRGSGYRLFDPNALPERRPMQNAGFDTLAIHEAALA